MPFGQTFASTPRLFRHSIFYLLCLNRRQAAKNREWPVAMLQQQILLKGFMVIFQRHYWLQKPIRWRRIIFKISRVQLLHTI